MSDKWAVSTCMCGVRCAVCDRIMYDYNTPREHVPVMVWRLKDTDERFPNGVILIGYEEYGEFAHRSCVDDAEVIDDRGPLSGEERDNEDD